MYELINWHPTLQKEITDETYLRLTTNLKTYYRRKVSDGTYKHTPDRQHISSSPHAVELNNGHTEQPVPVNDSSYYPFLDDAANAPIKNATDDPQAPYQAGGSDTNEKK